MNCWLSCLSVHCSSGCSGWQRISLFTSPGILSYRVVITCDLNANSAHLLAQSSSQCTSSWSRRTFASPHRPTHWGSCSSSRYLAATPTSSAFPSDTPLPSSFVTWASLSTS